MIRTITIAEKVPAAAGWALLAAATCSLSAPAQVPYQPPTGQTGRLFDANPQLGSGGYNLARPVSPLIVGNAVVGGNVRGGLTFQGFSPIPDPTAFRGPLYSTSLSPFRRDSVSIADARSPAFSWIGQPYYDLSQTVPSAGLLRGQYSAGWMGGRSQTAAPTAGPLDFRIDQRLSQPLAPVDSGPRSPEALRRQILGLPPQAAPELSSAIFGPRTSLSAALPAAGAWRSPSGTDARRGAWAGPVPPPALPGEPPGSRPPLGTPQELVEQGVIQRFPLEPGPDGMVPALTPETLLPLGPLTAISQPQETGVPPQAAPEPAVRLRDVSILPGYDVFTDMQLALSLAADPEAGWFAQMQQAIRSDPALAGMLRELADMRAADFVRAVLESPIQTFHGRGDSGKNNELLKAEALMDIGRYYEAARRYEVAHILDPLDPLPLIGKGNALLAAGEYLSAAVALVQGFERYPELSRFKLDLPALIGGREIIDIRRADLLERLTNQDDPRLRFLLGYLEYYSGDPALRESGLKHLERAAELDTSGSIISSFPALLRGERRPPPPKLPPATGEPPQPALPVQGEQ
jgi:hypothetical protein